MENLENNLENQNGQEVNLQEVQIQQVDQSDVPQLIEEQPLENVASQEPTVYSVEQTQKAILNGEKNAKKPKEKAKKDKPKSKEDKELEKAEKKKWKQARKQRKANKSYRNRKLKNFFLWLAGLFSGIALIGGGIAIGVTVVPLRTYIGDSTDVVSEKLLDKSILNAITGYSDLTFDDVPALKNVFVDFAKDPAISEYITIDAQKLGNLKISEIATGLSNCITIGVDDIYVSNFLDVASNQKTYDILVDGIGGGKTANTLTVGDLKDFNVDNVRLATVLEGVDLTGSKILQVIKDKNIKISELATAVNQLKLTEIFTDITFTTDTSLIKESSRAVAYYFDEATGTYSITGSGQKYYINKNSGVWLFLFYGFELGSDSDRTANGGSAISYTELGITLGTLEAKVSEISASIRKATIAQLVDSGILEGGYTNPTLYYLTLQEILSQLG